MPASLLIEGGVPLKGEVAVSAAKNAALPALAAALLTSGRLTLTNVPDLGDVRTMLKLLATLGAVPSIQARYQVHKNLRDAGNTSDEYIANLEEQCTAHYIKLSVQPDGARYSIEIPAKGHKKTFETRKR